MVRRTIYMDVLSILSCVAVVYLHCSNVVFLNEGNLMWFLAIVVQAVFSFAVPVFFMLSGANLLGYREKYDTKTFLKKRLKRVIVPLAGFSLLYYIISCCAPGAFGLPVREPSVSGFIIELLTNRICDVYWFMYSIISLYLVTPLLSCAARDTHLLRYLLALSFVSTAVIPLVNRFDPTHTLLSLFAIPYLTGPIFFYLLGYYVQHCVEIDDRIRGVLIACLFASLGIMIGMTFKTNVSHTVMSGTYADYDNFYVNIQNVFCIVYSCAIFGLMKRAEPWLRERDVFHSAGFRLLSSVTLYVYLIHMLVINMLDVYMPHSIIWDFGVRPPFVVIVSIAFGLLLIAVRAVVRRHCQNVHALSNFN